MKERWPGLLEKAGALGKKYRYVALVILAGVVLMLLPGGGEGEAERVTAEETAGLGVDVEALERRMEEALSQIQGAGEVTVVLTLKSGGERILASDFELDGDSRRETVVTVSQGSGQTAAVTVEETGTQFQGALVVCDGGNNPTVKLQVLNGVAALTGLGADQISISQRK